MIASDKHRNFHARRWLAACAWLATCSVQAEDPAKDQPPLRPFVTCVEPAAQGRLRAHWGYLNRTKGAIVHEPGASNHVTGSAEGVPPRSFQPGFVVQAFNTLFDAEQTSTWSLNGVTATADKRAHPCSPAERTTSVEQLINPAPGSAMFLGANFWGLQWQSPQEYFFDQASFAPDSNPWLPQLLRDLAPYKVLRFMDWNLTNDADNPQSTWSTRRPKGQLQREPIAYEWQIDLCNRSLKDYWVTVPHAASPEYFTQLAQLIRDQLDPRLRVYVEWSNEVWNGGFPQHGYARAKGTQLGLPGKDPAMSYQVAQSVRLFDAFAQVFGPDNPRVVNVLAGQAAWAGPCRAQLAALANPKINPKHIKPTVYAIAPYVRGESLEELRGPGLTETESWIRDQLSCTQSAGLPLIAYEGGQDSFALGVSGCERLQRDEGMRALYASLPDVLAKAGLRGPFVHYTHSGSCWGLKVHTSDSAASSPKYQGLLDWLSRSGAR